jgi:hypothetical protein
VVPLCTFSAASAAAGSNAVLRAAICDWICEMRDEVSVKLIG